MTGNNDLVHKKASKEATDWLILLNDDPEDAALRRAFEAWLHDSPANAAAWGAMQQASKAMDKATPVHTERWKPALAELRTKAEAGGADTAPSHIDRTRHSSPVNGRRTAARINRRQTVRLGGMAALACLLILFMGPGLLLDLQADYATGTAETRTIRLSDDSTITLAPESAIAVDYTLEERHIRILTGAAFFEVTPNADRPFQVAAKDIHVTVIGTDFVVHRGDDGADIAVEHGTVRVGHANAVPPVAETLTMGQSVRMSWTGRAERRAVPVAQIAAWRHDELIARDDPFGEVVARLRPYYAGRIVITDGALAAQPVTGVYDLDDPVSALRAIARAQNAAVRRVTPWLIIVSAS